MNCPSCKQDIPQDSKFCPYCGYSLGMAVSISEESSASEAASVPKKRKYKVRTVLLFVVLTGIFVLVCTYLGTYIAAKKTALRHDEIRAKQLIWMPSITQMHDPELLEYINAGLMYEQGKYKEAKSSFAVLDGYLDSAERARASAYYAALDLLEAGKYNEAKSAFTALGDYMDSIDRVKQASYGLALDQLEGGQYEAAQASFKALGSYMDSPDRVKEAIYYDAFEQLKTGSFSAYQTILSLVKEGFEPAVNGLAAANKQAYNYALSQYRAKRYANASIFFQELDGYERSADYLTLINAPSYEALEKLIGFANANEIIMDKFAIEYLTGTWETRDGDYFFTVQTEDGIDYWTSTNLPRTYLDNSFFSITDGVYIVFDKNTSYVQRLSGNFEKTNVFRFSIVSADIVSVYCYKDGNNRVLYRQ